MGLLSKRLRTLEERQRVDGPVRWVRIIVPKYQTQEQARAEYEAEHGAIGDDVGIIYRVIVSPDE